MNVGSDIMQHMGMVDIYYTGTDMNAEVSREEKALRIVVPTVHQASVCYLSIYIFRQVLPHKLISCFYAMIRCVLILYSAQIKVDKVIMCFITETFSHVGYVLLISSGVITHDRNFLK